MAMGRSVGEIFINSTMLTRKTLLIFGLIVFNTIENGYGAEMDYQWPFSASIGGAEVKVGVPALPPGCSTGSSPGHPSLPYQSIYFDSSPDSYVDVTIPGDQSIFSDFSFVMFLFQATPAAGTIMHLINPDVGSALPTGEIVIAEMLLSVNVTHLILRMTGPSTQDVGTFEILNPIPLNSWFPLAFSHDRSSGETIIMTEDVELLKSKLNVVEDVYLGQPTNVRFGGRKTKSDDHFQGSITCVGTYDGKISKTDFQNALSECLPEIWAVTPTTITSKDCSQWHGYFVVTARDTTPTSSITPLVTMTKDRPCLCGGKCLQVTECKGFTYNRTTKICKLFSSYSYVGVESSAGTHFYKRRDICC